MSAVARSIYTVFTENLSVFLPFDAMETRHMSSYGVRPSFRLSVTLVNSAKTSDRIFFFHCRVGS